MGLVEFPLGKIVFILMFSLRFKWDFTESSLIFLNALSFLWDRERWKYELIIKSFYLPITSIIDFAALISVWLGWLLQSRMSTSSTPRTKATWIHSFHEIFINLCLEQTLNGNRPGTHFTKEGWRNIVESFHAKTGARYDRRQLKNHWDSTKEQWRVWCKLTEAKSMKWDPETKTFGASPEDWNKYIQVLLYSLLKQLTLCLARLK